MKLPKLRIFIYCIISIILMILYMLISKSYDYYTAPDIRLFIAIGALYIIYIPWTIYCGIDDRRKNQRPDYLVISIMFSIFLLMRFYSEYTKRLGYIGVIDKFS